MVEGPDLFRAFYFCAMKKLNGLFILVLLTAIACGEGNGSDPNDHMSEFEQKGLMTEVVHYAAKLPPNATHKTKFNSKFDEYYSSVAADYKWVSMKPGKNGGYFYLITRPARSINPMFEGIGGYFKIENDSLVEYDEVFRTWKLPQEDLDVKGKMLFDRMVEGKDLTIYYPKFTGDQYIEFPDGRYAFDKQKRVWIDLTRRSN